MSKLELTVERRFEASHVLPNHPGKCSRLHGHSWVIRVTVDGYIDPITGFVCDYSQLKLIVDERIINRVDHMHLGQGSLVAPSESGFRPYRCAFGDDFYPSSENLTLLFRDDLVKHWAAYKFPAGVQLVRIEIDETCTSRCIWRRDDE